MCPSVPWYDSAIVARNRLLYVGGAESEGRYSTATGTECGRDLRSIPGVGGWTEIDLERNDHPNVSKHREVFVGAKGVVYVEASRLGSGTGWRR